MKKPFAINRLRWAALLTLLFMGSAYPQARNCDFWGTAKYRGANVTSGDVIKAYDSGGQLCGTAYYVGGGNYAVHVVGDDSGTPDIDEGAPDGGAITFRINNDIANVVSGSNVWTNNGSIQCNIEVFDLPPDAQPGGPYTGFEGSPVQFDGSGSTGAATYAWNFGDSQSGGGMTPTHAYANPGTYTVTLTVTNGSGQTSTKSTTATIANVAPTVNASSDAPKNEGSTVNFTGSASDPTPGEVLQYAWTFGDGSSATGQNTSHPYVNHGNYTARLTVTDHEGATNHNDVAVTINNVPPVANAGLDKTVNEGTTVAFSGSATDPGIPGSGNGYGVKDVLSYSWNFGDGQTANGKDVSHLYSQNTTHNVVLTVSDGTDTGTDNLNVTVNNVAPTANAGGPYIGTINYPVQFHGSAADPGGASDPLTFTWDLDNDGQYDDFTGTDPTKTYTSTGDYTVSLKVTDGDGAFGTSTAAVSIGLGVLTTFKTQPAGMQVKVDGVMYPTPKDFYFSIGSVHAIEALPSQVDYIGSKYVFTSWSDGGPLAHYITITSQPTTYTASYRRQYQLIVDDSGKNAHPRGSGYYDPGTQVPVSVDASVFNADSTMRNRFDRWQGSGSGSYSGGQLNITITMGNNDIIQKVLWTMDEYLVRVVSPYGTPHGAGWYVAGSDASVSVDSSVSTGPGKRQSFLRWTGQGAGSYTGTANPASIKVNAPIIQTAEWKVEYFVDIQSVYGSPSGEGWYLQGGTATIRCDTVVLVHTGKQACFSGWFGTGAGSYTGGLRQKTLTVNAPITEAVQWKIQYLLVVVGFNTEDGKWYDEGSRAIFSANSPVYQGEDTRYRFNQWNGIGAGSYTGNLNPAEVVMTGPITEEAVWDKEYFVVITVDPERSGTVLPFSEEENGGWGKASDQLELRAVGKADSGYGFSHWSGDASGSVNPLSILLNGPKRITAHFKQGSVIITTEPSGRNVTIDGNETASPVVFDWIAGEQHTIGTNSPQGDGSTVRYTFLDWSDGGAISHAITVSSTSKKYTARFQETFFLNVDSKFGIFTGEGWYVKNATATVSIDTAANVTADSRQRFKGWTGTGPGSVSSAAPVIQCQMLGPITEQVQWEEQVKVQTSVFPPNVPGSQILIDPLLVWYPIGNPVTLRAVANDPVHYFLKWTGNWSGNAVSTDNPLTLIVSKPLLIRGWFWVKDDPPVITHFPDLTMREDETLKYTFDWLRQFISDPNDPLETLDIQFKKPKHVDFTVDFEKQELIIKPLPHWNGTEQAIVTVTDPYGLSDADTFNVKVLSIEDPPGPFMLISPFNNMKLDNWESPLEFRWRRAVDPDEGDAVEYSLILSDTPDLRGTGVSKRMSPIPDTTLLLSPQVDGSYYWGVIAQDKRGNTTFCDSVFKLIVGMVAVKTDKRMPMDYELGQNYPNPFNPGTTIPFQVPRPGNVVIRIVDMRGRIVRTLENGRFDAGSYDARWDGMDENGSQAASGVYVIWIQAGDFVKQRKMILLR